MKIRWLRSTVNNVEEITDYIAEDDPSAAADITERIFSTVATLADFPHLGRPGRVSETRELVVTGTPCIIPYRVRDDHIEILRVFHSARRWPKDL